MAAASAAFLCYCERKYRGVKAGEGGERRKGRSAEEDGREWGWEGRKERTKRTKEKKTGRKRRGKKEKTVQGRRQLSLSHWVACHPQRSGSRSEPPPRLVRGKMGMYKGLALDAAWVKPPPRSRRGRELSSLLFTF